MNKKVKNPWKILSSKVVYESPFLKVVEDRVITPEGKEGIHNLIYGGRGGADGVQVIALNEKNEIYLVKQYRYAYGDYTLELVNGGIDCGEEPLEAAKRELEEEANLKAETWKPLTVTYFGTESVKQKNYVYLATNIKELEKEYKGENKMEVIKVPLKEAVTLVMENRIPLSASALGILMVEKMLDPR